MWTQTASLLLLLICCLPAGAQERPGQNIWEAPLKFSTKDQDSCNMVVTGQGDYTRLRVQCRSARHSYWCEYLGTPQLCRSYNMNPRHYFVQMMWGFRRLHNACRAPQTIKPHMCRKATDDSQMVFRSTSFSRSRPGTLRSGPRQASHPRRPQPGQVQGLQTRPTQRPQARTLEHGPTEGPGPRPTERPSPEPTRLQERGTSVKSMTAQPPAKTIRQPRLKPAEMTRRSKLAERFCWRSLHRVCSFVIGLFQD